MMLIHPTRHPRKQRAKAELFTGRLRFLPVTGSGRPSPAHQKVEREHFREHVVVMELRRGRDAARPCFGAEAYGVDAFEQERPTRRAA